MSSSSTAKRGSTPKARRMNPIHVIGERKEAFVVPDWTSFDADDHACGSPGGV